MNLAAETFIVFLRKLHAISVVELFVLQFVEAIFKIQIVLLFLKAHVFLQLIKHRGHAIVSHLVVVLLADHCAQKSLLLLCIGLHFVHLHLERVQYVKNHQSDSVFEILPAHLTAVKCKLSLLFEKIRRLHEFLNA